MEWKYSLTLSKKYYESVGLESEEIVKEINAMFLESVGEILHISHLSSENRIQLYFDNTTTHVGFHDRLAVMLCFKQSIFSNPTSLPAVHLTAEDPLHLFFSSTRLFVCSDIVKPQIVGDSFSASLYTLLIKGRQRVIINMNPIRS